MRVLFKWQLCAMVCPYNKNLYMYIVTVYKDDYLNSWYYIYFNFEKGSLYITRMVLFCMSNKKKILVLPHELFRVWYWSESMSFSRTNHFKIDNNVHSDYKYKNMGLLYFVSSRERPWRHWACLRIHVAKRILYTLLILCSFLNVWENTISCTRDDERLLFRKYALTSQSRSRGETKLAFVLYRVSQKKPNTHTCFHTFIEIY